MAIENAIVVVARMSEVPGVCSEGFLLTHILINKMQKKMSVRWTARNTSAYKRYH